MTFQTVQDRHAAKHADRISNARVFTLDNHFSGEPYTGTAAALIEHTLRFGTKIQINKAAGKGRIRHHGNHWLEFDYRA
jgi:hypothetical protein